MTKVKQEAYGPRDGGTLRIVLSGNFRNAPRQNRL